ncbi:uncharacterized protein TNCV_2372531 [Trichonephila clavipes]|nr:uncharacterized protein TNCV_2372531 [Trichonephila clavipes]
MMDSGKFQRHDGSGRPRATADREDRLIVRSTVTAPDSSLSTIRRVTCTRVSTTNIHRRPIERNFCSYQPLTPPATYACTLSSQIKRHPYSTTVLRRHSEKCFATVHFAVPWPYFSEDKARPHAARVAMNCLTACQTPPWPPRSPDLSLIEHAWDMVRRRLHPLGNVDDLTR